MSNADDGGSSETKGQLPADPPAPPPPAPPPPPPPSGVTLPPSSPADAPPTEPSAKTAFICGVVSIVLALFIPILGVILAVVTFILIPRAEQKIAASNGALGGESQLRSARIAAIAAIVVAIVNFIIAVTIVLD